MTCTALRSGLSPEKMNLFSKQMTASRFIFCLLTVLALQPLRAQHNRVMERISTLEGLPSNTVYATLEDRRGFVWLATDRGVCRYNGIDFETFTVEDGLADNEVFSLFEDSKGRIWFGTFNGQLCYFHSEQFFSYKNSTLPRIKTNSYTKSFREDENGTILIQSFGDGIFVLYPNGKLSHLLEGEEIDLLEKTNGRILLINNTKHGSCRQYFPEFSNGTLQLNQAGSELPFRVQPFSSYYNEGTLYFLSSFDRNNDTFFFYRNGELHKTLLPFEVKQVYFFERLGETWHFGTSDGLYITDSERKKVLSQQYAGIQLVHRREDPEGDVWYGTLQHGLIRESKNQSGELWLNAPVYSLLVDSANQKLWVGSRDAIYQVDPVSGACDTFLIPGQFGINNVIYTLHKLGGDTVFAGSGKLSFMLINGRYQGFYNHSGTRDLLILGNYVFVAKGTGFFRDNRNQFSVPESQRKLTDVKTILPWTWSKALGTVGDKIYLGSNSGLFLYQNDTALPLLPEIHGRITSLATRNNLLAVGTASDGLYLILNDRIIWHTSALLSVNDLGFLSDSLLLAVNEQGVFGISFRKKVREQQVQLMHVQKSANAFVRLPDASLFVGGLGGLYRYTAAKKQASRSPALYIRSLRISGELMFIGFEKELELAHHQNQIQLRLLPVCFLPGAQLRYQYRVNGGEWVNLLSPELNLGPLSSGSYELEFRVFDYTRWSDDLTLKIQVNPAWYDTWWFRLILALVFVGIVSMTFYLRNRNNRLRAARQLEVSELKQKALRAQINPHFLFNVLNSIQHFFLKKRTHDGQEYLGKFALLMRSILNHSDETFISLQEEMDRLELYMELEQIRNDNSFSFDLVMDASIDPYDMRIPSMMLQPFLENAIWHGIRPGGTDSRISLRFYLQDKHLLCEIHDNGPGFDLDKLRYGQSKGIHLIMERIQAINDLYGTRMKLEFNTDNGTLVRLSIPLDIMEKL